MKGYRSHVCVDVNVHLSPRRLYELVNPNAKHWNTLTTTETRHWEKCARSIESEVDIDVEAG